MLFIQGAQNLNSCRPCDSSHVMASKGNIYKMGIPLLKKKERNLSINVPSQVMTNSLVFCGKRGLAQKLQRNVHPSVT
jgi:hypothetical protein